MPPALLPSPRVVTFQDLVKNLVKRKRSICGSPRVAPFAHFQELNPYELPHRSSSGLTR